MWKTMKREKMRNMFTANEKAVCKNGRMEDEEKKNFIQKTKKKLFFAVWREIQCFPQRFPIEFF